MFKVVMVNRYFLMLMLAEPASSFLGASFATALAGPAMRAMYSFSVGRLPPSNFSTLSSLK
jgi:hypothetical protein